jgi:hypothetical protein
MPGFSLLNQISDLDERAGTHLPFGSRSSNQEASPRFAGSVTPQFKR